MTDVTYDECLAILNQHFRLSSFRGFQYEVIAHLLNRQAALVIMPTGGGKSICYQLPALYLAKQESHDKPPLSIVISPLIALMKDQVDTLKRYEIDAEFVNSSLTREERQERYEAIARGEFDLLYVTPERFRKPDFCAVLETRKVVLLAIDEAHCISQWGHDFRPDYTRVGDIRQQLGSPPTIALTATATAEVQQDIIRQLGLAPDQVRIFHAGIDRPNLDLDVVEVWDDEEKLEQIVSVLERHPGAGIVYFTLIRTLERFSDYLRAKHIEHLVYHGELARANRRAIQEQFLTEPNQLVLATNAFGMGIDKENIRFVIHAELPGSIEAYYQEIGRAGRDGAPSQCLLLYQQDDLATQMEFMQWSNPDQDYYARLHDFLAHDVDAINAWGIEWLRERLHARRKHDHRLETALAMLERYGVLEGNLDPLQIEGVNSLPPQFTDSELLQKKLHSDQRRLLHLVEYVRAETSRKSYLTDYFS